MIYTSQLIYTWQLSEKLQNWYQCREEENVDGHVENTTAHVDCPVRRSREQSQEQQEVRDPEREFKRT